MKELSIEEKAKRYDEAIEQLRAMMPNWENLSYNGKTFLQDLVYIIPELAESEDEEIRKALIELVHDTTGDSLWVDYDIHREEAIAWLEKQGEQPKKHDVCDNCDQQGSCVSPCPMKLVEKQGEQKHNSVLDIEIPFGAKDSELQEASYYIPEGFHAEIEGNRVVIKKGEQKPAWSDEDEEMARRCREGVDMYFTQEDKEGIHNWLVSLKDRVQPQSKQEWSEENKKMLGLLFDLINYASDFYIHEDKSTDLKQWLLKSLRPHSTWKPSDEQMKALADALSLAKNCGEESAFDLGTLQDDLKRLW